jgi:PilZ domain
MSALEQGSLDRRTAPRLRVTGTLPALIGRGDGALVDLSARGAKVRHSTMIRRNAIVRISFRWQGQRFSASAEVLSSRVVSLGRGDTPTMYESRLRFEHVTPEADAVLARVLDSLAGRDARRWVANLRGWDDEIAPAAAPAVTSYLRCRFFGTRWEVKCTNALEQPEDGFLLPATIDDNEIVRLCADYSRADADGRRVMRLMAAAAVEESLAAGSRSALARPA